jgi:hypothetical protein
MVVVSLIVRSARRRQAAPCAGATVARQVDLMVLRSKPIDAHPPRDPTSSFVLGVPAW